MIEMHAENNDPCILAIDASGDQASVALWRDGELLGQSVHDAKHGHAATLVPMAQQLMADHELPFAAVTHIAGGRGPGSFTGIRVALAAAKGFCLATGAAPLGISVLEANAQMAASSGLNNGRHMLITADTRRGSLYAQMFDASGIPLGDIIDVEPKDVISRFGLHNDNVVCAGPMVENLTEFSTLNIMLDLPYPDAGQIARLAAANIAQNVAPVPLAPLYLAPAFLGPKRAK